MNILDDMRVSKLSAKVFFKKVNYSFNPKFCLWEGLHRNLLGPPTGDQSTLQFTLSNVVSMSFTPISFFGPYLYIGRLVHIFTDTDRVDCI